MVTIGARVEARSVERLLQIAYTVGATKSGMMSDPKQIPTEVEYKAAMEEIERIWNDTSPEASARLDFLADLIVAYEEVYFSELRVLASYSP